MSIMPSKSLPTFDELPSYKNFKGCAWEIWGPDDQLGTVNLLTPEVVKRAASEEIRTGKSVSLNWPINFPAKPLFGRIAPEITVLDRGYARDDEIHINTQSGTQWDGLRHFGLTEHHMLYNGVRFSEIKAGPRTMPDPTCIDPDLIKLGIHNWAKHGISGRGVLLDLVSFYTKYDRVPLPYDPWSTHGFTVSDLMDVANAEKVEFREGDILLIRAGFTRKYNQSSEEEKDKIAGMFPNEEFAGIEQSEEMKKFLWDNHFAAVASDQPGLEQLPPREGEGMLHQTILGLWGMPLGELFDLEELSEECARTGRYTFFFSSWPLNILGGCASPANAAAYF